MHPPEDPRAGLRRLFRAIAPAPIDPPAELEAGILEAHRRRYPPTPRRASVWSFIGAHRFAAAGFGCALAIGACQIPSAYERSFGTAFECTVDREALAAESVQEAVDPLREGLAADNLSIRVFDDGGPTIALRIDAWGPIGDPAAALAAIRGSTPGLADAACTAEVLTATVHGTLGGHLGYSLLHAEFDHEDADAARARILEELSAQGFTGTAEVEVEDEMGHRKVKIRLQQEVDGEHSVAEDETIRPLEREVEVERRP